MISNYSYLLDQQLRYLEFFQDVTGQKVDCQQYLSTTLMNCQKAISANLPVQIKGIELGNSSHIEYFEKAIEHLESCKEDNNCVLKIAKANNSIGDIHAKYEKPLKALSAYIKALKMDKTLAETYEKLGDILADKGKYKTALDFYKVADQTSKVEHCYDKLITKSAKDQKLKFFEEKGDYLASAGETHKSIECYNKAKELTYDKVVKTALLNKVQLLITNKDEIIKNIDTIKTTGEFYKFDLVKLDQIDPNNIEILLSGDL
jgi:tetratricopeptide (TPR) repeat protein